MYIFDKSDLENFMISSLRETVLLTHILDNLLRTIDTFAFDSVDRAIMEEVTETLREIEGKLSDEHISNLAKDFEKSILRVAGENTFSDITNEPVDPALSSSVYEEIGMAYYAKKNKEGENMNIYDLEGLILSYTEKPRRISNMYIFDKGDLKDFTKNIADECEFYLLEVYNVLKELENEAVSDRHLELVDIGLEALDEVGKVLSKEHIADFSETFEWNILRMVGENIYQELMGGQIDEKLCSDVYVKIGTVYQEKLAEESEGYDLYDLEQWVFDTVRDAKRPKTVIISQPMAGKSTDAILKSRQPVIDALAEKGTVVISTIFEPDGKKGVKHEPVRYLAKTIRALSEVDAVVFIGDWRNSRGCRIEREVCEEYGIQTLEGNDVLLGIW